MLYDMTVWPPRTVTRSRSALESLLTSLPNAWPGGRANWKTLVSWLTAVMALMVKGVQVVGTTHALAYSGAEAPICAASCAARVAASKHIHSRERDCHVAKRKVGTAITQPCVRDSDAFQRCWLFRRALRRTPFTPVFDGCTFHNGCCNVVRRRTRLCRSGDPRSARRSAALLPLLRHVHGSPPPPRQAVPPSLRPPRRRRRRRRRGFYRRWFRRPHPRRLRSRWHDGRVKKVYTRHEIDTHFEPLGKTASYLPTSMT